MLTNTVALSYLEDNEINYLEIKKVNVNQKVN